MNLFGALRRAMATTGYSDLKEFQRVEVVVAPIEPPDRGSAPAHARMPARRDVGRRMSTAQRPRRRPARDDALRRALGAPASSTCSSSAAGIVGAGAALDAVTRGPHRRPASSSATCAAGTSSAARSKLVHGGLRYLEMLDFGLVREALQERGLLLTRLAPHLVRPVPFLYPLTHRGWERPYVGAGLALYDAHGDGRASTTWACPRHRHLIRSAGRRGSPPTCDPTTLAGAIRYYDCQVDDARLVVTLARTAAAHGAHVATRTQVTGFLREGERVVGVRAARPRDRPRARGPGPGGGQRGRGLDRRDPGDGRRPRRAQRPGQQGHPPRRAARPDPLRGRPHHCAPRRRCCS